MPSKPLVDALKKHTWGASYMLEALIWNKNTQGQAGECRHCPKLWKLMTVEDLDSTVLHVFLKKKTPKSPPYYIRHYYVSVQCFRVVSAVEPFMARLQHLNICFRVLWATLEAFLQPSLVVFQIFSSGRDSCAPPSCQLCSSRFLSSKVMLWQTLCYC